jgi:hypothetical protein
MIELELTIEGRVYPQTPNHHFRGWRHAMLAGQYAPDDRAAGNCDRVLSDGENIRMENDDIDG